MAISIDRENGILTIYLNGDIDHHSAIEIRTQIDAEIRRNMPKKLIFDMEKVGFSDSSGIGLILGRYRLLSPVGVNISLVNVKKPVYKVFKLGGLDRYISMSERNDL